MGGQPDGDGSPGRPPGARLIGGVVGVARAAYDKLAHSHKREHVHAVESAKNRGTRRRRVEKAIATPRS
ncbi:YdeI/OmpD-associated family protein [Catellatospora sp. NPDC049111]|uniref:YdeI/OmpD-associated family protein n=1 Tax=Catellatospora sp. NPDC049111 TaxID=3155271 RepID=UPI00340703DB